MNSVDLKKPLTLDSSPMRKILAFLLLLPFYGYAQFEVVPTVVVPAKFSDGSSIKNPWTGGLNAAQISMFDADMDGNEDDIFVFDKAGNRVLVYIGTTSGGQRTYKYHPKLSKQFPPITDWALLRDFDCDGKRDIFTYSPAGGAFAVYRNTTTSPDQLSFELDTEVIESFYEFSSTQFTTNIYVSSQDVPGIFDFDGDGDLDILTFAVGGSVVELHLNYSVENDGECGLDFVLKNKCYGLFAEGSENNGIIQDPETVGSICSFNVVDPKRNGGGGARHVGSTILAFDANQDDLAEIILGDVTYFNMTYLENNDRGDQVDSVGYVSTTFPSDFGAMQVDIDNFPAGFYEDIDGDGVNDLIVGVNNHNVAENKNSIWLYLNEGLNNLPEFEFQRDNFLQDETLDAGSGSAPAIFDYNQDGLKDIVFGSRGEFQGLGSYLPTLTVLLNEGTAEEPSFRMIDDNWLDVNNLGIGQYVHPHFADLDNDGDEDLILGEASGVIHYFRNDAESGEDANMTYVGLLQADGADLDVGQNSAPTLFDLNGDGLLDITIGERNGNLNYYENVGTAEDYEFNFVTDTLGGISGVAQNYFVGNTGPQFFEHQGETFLSLGNENGRVFTYTNISDDPEAEFELFSNDAFNINGGRRVKAVITDIDGDELPDVIVGHVGGGLELYVGDLTSSTQNRAPASMKLEIFPNPGSDEVRIANAGQIDSNAPFRIFNISGSLVQNGLTTGGLMKVSNLPSGIYIIEVISGQNVFRAKWVKK